MPFDRRTRATFRKAELGFLGVMVLTCRQTPRFCGHRCMAGCLGLRYCCRRGLRTSWLIVGIHLSRQHSGKFPDAAKTLPYSPTAPWSRLNFLSISNFPMSDLAGAECLVAQVSGRSGADAGFGGSVRPPAAANALDPVGQMQ